MTDVVEDPLGPIVENPDAVAPVAHVDASDSSDEEIDLGQAPLPPTSPPPPLPSNIQTRESRRRLTENTDAIIKSEREQQRKMIEMFKEKEAIAKRKEEEAREKERLRKIRQQRQERRLLIFFLKMLL